MKKRFLLGVLAIALLFVISGCEDPTTYTLNRDIQYLPGPDNLRANVYEGMIILQWDAVPNAYDYQVIRKDTVSGVNVDLGSVSGKLYLIDTVSWKNQLFHDRDYEYSVISQSKTSTIENNSGGEIVQNGVSVVGAVANIPAIQSFAPVLNASDISVSRQQGPDNADYVWVQFPNKPNYNFTVAYEYGQNQAIIQEINNFSKAPYSNSDTWYNPKIAVRMPTIGGGTTITVRAQFPNDYYTAVKEVTKTASYDMVPLLDNITGADFERFGGNVFLYWGDVPNATGYKIYKATINANTNIVTSDWTLITTVPEFVLGYPGAGQQRWQAKDAIGNCDGYYRYIIIAEGANGAKSKPATIDVSPYVIPSVPSFTSYTVINGVVEFTWTPTDGDTYTINYVKVEPITGTIPSAGNYVVVGSYLEPIQASTGTASTPAALAPGWYIFKISVNRYGISSEPSKAKYEFVEVLATP